MFYAGVRSEATKAAANSAHNLNERRITHTARTALSDYYEARPTATAEALDCQVEELVELGFLIPAKRCSTNEIAAAI